MKKLILLLLLFMSTIPLFAVEEMVTYEKETYITEKHWYTRDAHDYTFFANIYASGCCYNDYYVAPPFGLGANVGYLFDYRIGLIAGVNFNMYTTYTEVDGRKVYTTPYIDGRFGLAFKYISFGLQYTFNNPYSRGVNSLGGFGIITIPLWDYLALNFIFHGTCASGLNLGAGLSFILP